VDPEHGAGLLHRLTSYVPDRPWDRPVDDPRVRHDLVPNDPAHRPPPLKSFPTDLPVQSLPRALPESGPPATDVLAGLSCPRRPLDAAQLGRMLFLGAGVTRTVEHQGRQALFRASGSAGGRFPLELYASVHDVTGVPDGVHWYDPLRHALVRIGPPAHAAGDGTPVTTLVVTGVPWRTGWRYAERGWRHLYWDGGTLLSQLEAAAAGAGLDPRPGGLFPDAVLTALVGADGVNEYPIAVLALGDGAPAVVPSAPAVAGDLPAVEFPLCTAAQRAGDRNDAGDLVPPVQLWPRAPVVPDPPTPPARAGPSAPTLDAVVLRRGSQRLMDRSATLPRSVLAWSTAVALRGVDLPHWVVVHGVDDTPPGVYRWPDLTSPVREGDLREELVRICLDQDLAGDAAFVVIAACLAAVLDDRGYRQAQLTAGLVEGRLHLAAYALGAGASGMTFLDSEVPGLLALPDAGPGEDRELVTLLFTCVGVPEYVGRPGGAPGAPVPVRMVTPRLR